MKMAEEMVEFRTSEGGVGEAAEPRPGAGLGGGDEAGGFAEGHGGGGGVLRVEEVGFLQEVEPCVARKDRREPCLLEARWFVGLVALKRAGEVGGCWQHEEWVFEGGVVGGVDGAVDPLAGGGGEAGGAGADGCEGVAGEAVRLVEGEGGEVVRCGGFDGDGAEGRADAAALRPARPEGGAHFRRSSSRSPRSGSQ